jgi:hypothetical protein
MKLNIERANPLTCRLYLGRRSRRTPYYKCFVFANKHELWVFAAEQARLIGAIGKEGTPEFWRGTEGLCRWWGRQRDMDAGRMRGVILLHRARMGVGVVTHEATHAAIFHVLGGNRPRPFSWKHDEPIPLHAGELARQFWNWAWNQHDKQSKKKQGKSR